MTRVVPGPRRHTRRQPGQRIRAALSFTDGGPSGGCAHQKADLLNAASYSKTPNRTGLQRLNEVFFRRPFPVARAAAVTLMAAYALILWSSYVSVARAASPGMSLAPCGSELCVSRVAPGGKAWAQGVRPGMTLVAIDGETPAGAGLSLHAGNATNATLRATNGDILDVAFTPGSIVTGPTRFSIWFIGGMFALLGAVVVLRRPDLPAAWTFGAFAGFAALGLGSTPGAVDRAPQWTVVVQSLSLIGMGALFAPVSLGLVRDMRPYRLVVVPAVVLLVIAGAGIGALYLAATLYAPAAPLYDGVRAAHTGYLVATTVAALAVLFIEGVRARSSSGQWRARIVLLGIAIGMLPFFALTLLPRAVAGRSLLPVHITMLGLGLAPLWLAYAILHQHVLGIRKLVHRGMVYSITTLTLLVVIVVILTVVAPLPREASAEVPSLVLALTLVGGIVTFFPLRYVARRFVDSFIYKDVVDYERAFQVVQTDLHVKERTSETATRIVRSLAQLLGLESAVLLIGDTPSAARVAASVGERADQVYWELRAQLDHQLGGDGVREIVELGWKSDSILLCPLYLSERSNAWLILGPKRGGEVFVDEEKRLVTNMSQLLSLAIENSQLSEELRALNVQLVDAQERERARIASDIHDGPLQTAIMLTNLSDGSWRDGRALARKAVVELREICSNLHPAILDDLGPVAAIEWLLDGVSKYSDILTVFSLHGVDEDARFSRDVEQTVFRVTQEATNNVVKHAKASSLNVSLTREDGSLALKVSDNGIGFSTPQRHRGGSGISGMRERIMQLNGTLTITSVPGQGTTIIARIPVAGKVVTGE